MELKRQIYLGFAFVVILPLLTALWTIKHTRSVDAQVSVLQHQAAFYERACQLESKLAALESAWAAVILLPRDEGLVACRSAYEALDTLFQELVKTHSDPELTLLRDMAEAYHQKTLQIFRAHHNPDAAFYEGGQILDHRAPAPLTLAIERFQSKNQALFKRAMTEAQESAAYTRTFTGIASFFAYLTGIIIALVFAYYVSAQDLRLRLANHELAARYEDLSKAKDLLERQIEEREKVERRLRRSLSFEEALSQVSNLFTTNHHPDMRQITKTLGQVVLCDLTFVIVFDEQGTGLEHQVEWVLPEALPARPPHYNLDFRGHRDWLLSLSEDGNIVVEDVRALTSDNPADLQFLAELPLVSLAIVPISSKRRKLWGYMGFAQYREPRAWSIEAMRLLRVACEMLSNNLARQRAEERLKYDAFHDHLTGLPNRSLFMDRLGHLIDRFARHPDEQFAVLFLDLDRFKPINDSMGHPVGDQLLIQVARALEVCVRTQDTIARMGGDEFTVILEDIGDVSEVKTIAKRILTRIELPFLIGEHEVHTSASIGIKLCTQADSHPDNVVRDADIAMYEAKNRGKSRYVFFQPSMHRQTTAVVQLENELRKAVERDELILHYQPILSFETGMVTGFEALLRWNNQARGMISPAEFIPLAEETGLIVPIGRWVIRKACEQVKQWHLDGFTQISVAVNVSAKQFYERSLTDDIAAIIAEVDIPPSAINLELTESLLMENMDLNIATLKRLSDMSIPISIDDFGTGYSSLSYLKRFPLNTLKVDQSFVRDIPGNNDDTAITSAIIAMGLSLNLKLVAEGVENEEQYHFLKAKGCHKFQGFLVSGPLQSKAATDLLISDYRVTLPAKPST